MTAPALKTVYIADFRDASDIPELSLVKTRVDLEEGNIRIPAGSIGTVVLSVPEKNGYEIEFTEPVQAVVGAIRDEIDPV